MEVTEEMRIGYKKTKLGWIPEDWEVIQMSNICTFFSGGTPKSTQSDFYGGSIPFIRSAEIDAVKTNLFLTEAGLNNSSAKIVENGDLLMALYGANSGEIAICKIQGAINQAVLCIRTSESKVFLLNYFLKEQNSILAKYLQGGQGNLSAQIIKRIKIPLPPLPEQKKIADILSTWDKAIEITQALIDKLQLRKKGLMQQLLSGNKRLPGFSGEWDFIKASEIFGNHTDKNHEGEFEVLSATQDQGVIPRSQTGIDIKYDKSSLKNYKKIAIGDFVISLRSFQGGIEYSYYDGLVSPAYTVLREKIEIDKMFYKAYLKTETFINRLNSIIYGIRDGKQISYRDFSSLKLLYPIPEEQTAIAQVLTKADEEIAQTQQYIEQLQVQKKGLMQQLLTGQKRVKV